MGVLRSSVIVTALVAGFVVVGEPSALALNDTAPPTVASYVIVPTTVNVTKDAASATAVLRIQDTDGSGNPGSGFDHGTLTLSNGTNTLPPVAIGAFDRVSGTATDGTYDVFVSLPQGTPGGSYTASDIALNDVFGSGTGHATSPTALTVTRTADTTAPALVGSVAVSAPTVNVTSAAATVIYTVTITDAVSGASQVSLDLTGPDDGFGAQTDTLFFSSATGTANSGTWTAQKTFTPFDTPGSWTPTALHLTDGYGNAGTVNSPAGGAVTVSKTVDTTAPTLVSVGVNPTSVTTTDGGQTLTVTVAASDATAGVTSGNVAFVSPDQQDSVFGGFAGAPTTGTAYNGSWSFTVDVPLRSPAGTWTLDSVSVQDAQGQSLDLVSGDPDLPGTTFSVTTQSDVNGPVLTQFTLGPPTVTAAYGGGATVTGVVGFTDAVSGFESGSITFRDPANAVSNSVTGDLFLFDDGPGTGHSGTIAYSVFVPNLPANIGTWTVDKVELVDRAQVATDYSTAQLSGMSLPTTFTVTAAATDTQAPNLTSLAVAPTSVNTTTGDKTVTVTAGITDPDSAASGFGFGSVTLQSPSHLQTQFAYFDTNLTGNAKTGTWSATLTIPKYAENGLWTVSQVELDDNADHSRILLGGDLASAGLTTTLSVTAAVDTTAPTLTGVTLDTPTVNTATSTAVSFHLTATDAASGVTALTVQLSGPGGKTRIGTGFPDSPAASANEAVDVGIPFYNSNGTWTTSAITVTDLVGNKHQYSASDLSSLGLSRTVTVTSAADTTAPVATGLKLTPSPVDTTGGPVAVDVLVHLTDAASGVASVSLAITSPHGTQAASTHLNQIAGTRQDGWYQGTWPLPKYVDPGTWVVGPLVASDSEGNTLTMTSAQLTSAGQPGTLSVTGPPDPNPPALTALTISPASSSNATAHAVTFTVTASDAESGVASAALQITAPGSSFPEEVFLSPLSASGTSRTYQGTYQLPAFATPGTWPVSGLVLADGYGNQHSFTNAQLVSAGVANSSFTVTGTADTTPPALTGLTLSPTTTDVSGGPTTVNGTVTATDNQSGVSDIEIVFQSPNGLRHVASSAFVENRTSGTTANPTIPFTLLMPQYAQAGDWTLSSVTTTDEIGNQQTYTVATVPPTGVATVLHVVDTNPDVTAPTLVGVSAPTTLDVHTSAGNLVVDVHLSDAASGVASGSVKLTSPSHQDVRTLDFDAANRISGTLADGTYRVSFPFGTATESGAWALTVQAGDVAENLANFSGAQITGTASVTITGTPVKPSAPTSVSALGGNQKATIAWATPPNGGAAVTGYVVTPTRGGVVQPSITVGVVNQTVVTGLTNGMTYTFTVAAANSVGTGTASSPSNAVVPAPTAPAAPSITGAMPGDTSVALTWTAPTDNGGATVTGYDVSVYDAALNLLGVTHLGSGLTRTVTGLTNDVGYYLGVAAVNSVGTGPEDLTTLVTPVAASATAPGAPSIVSAALSGGTGVALSWNPPASNGGAALTGYVVTPYVGAVAQASHIQNLGVVTSTTVTGLTKGVTYTFKVAAKNAVGTGAASAASGSVLIPTTAPGAPTGVTASSGFSQVTVQWSAPADTGGSAITQYIVTPYIGATAQPTKTVTGTSTTVTGLTNGTAYTFTVKAQNAIGIGAASAPSAAATPSATVPGAPGAPVAKAGNANVVLSWTAPATNGGSPVTGYIVTPVRAGVVQAPIPLGVVLATTVGSLTNGVSYTFRVHAVNAVGAGPDATSAAAVPRVPTKLAITSAPALATYNVPISVAGKLTRADTNAAVAGQTVRLLYRRKGSTGAFSTFATASTSSSTGTVAFTTFRPLYPVELRLTYATTGALLGVTSAGRIVGCQMNISLAQSTTSTLAGRTVTFSGAVAPSHAGKTIYLQRFNGTSWVNVATKVLSSSSTYAIALKVSTRGTFKYRALMPADATFSTSVSVTRTLKVS